jgi:hypothetical protein
MAVDVPLQIAGGLVCSARPEDLPEGASPRTYDTDFMVGRWRQRAGQRSVYTFAGLTAGPNGGGAASNVGAGTPWNNPNSVLLNDGSFATVPFSGGGVSSGLNVTEFGFNLPSSVGITGIGVSLKCFASSTANVQVQLLVNGVASGSPITLPMPSSAAVLTFGGPNSVWGLNLTSGLANSTSFGVQITASSAFSLAVGSVGRVSITVYQTPPLANFNYVKSFESSNGGLKTLALDADGNWWVEDVTNDPGVLTSLLEGITPGSYANSVTQEDREYTCFSDLNTGSDIPRQYTGQWIDKITQVGPAAPPSFIANNNQGGAVQITAFSISSNVVTFTAVNTFTAGELVGISGLSVGTYLNGQSLTVSSSGLSGTQFEAGFAHANVASTPDSGTATPQSSYGIVSITQPAPGFPGQVGFFDGILLSSGPGSVSAGNVVTIYTANARAGHFPGGDPVLTAAFNSGLPVYVFVSGAPFGNGTQLVTSIGLAVPPFAGASAERWYFTFSVPTAGAQSQGVNDASIPGEYQISAATLTTSVPIPGAAPGNQITIVGSTPTAWNNTWTLTAALNSGAYAITETTSSGGVATYSWTLISGVAPTTGELVTVTGTLGADGAFNVTDAVIASVAGTSAGTFTINGILATSAVTTESGQATTAGTLFQFDPGPADVGTSTSPIFGNGTGGQVTLVGAASQPIGSGTRQGVVLFLTRNGAITAPSPPVTFTTPDNTSSINVSNIPLGPPGVVIARIIAFTEAGQNGVPGANFYYIPVPVLTTVFSVTTTNNSTQINDNTTTSTSFSFTDAVLLNGIAIDVQGNNTFNQIEIGNPAWVISYASRNFYGRCQNKVQNFNNLSFDGGFLSTATPQPLGWAIDPNFNPLGSAVQLLNSPIFGNSYYIQNATGSVGGPLGLINQTAYQDAFQVPILLPNTAYSVRVTARAPSGLTSGSLQVDLVGSSSSGYGTSYGALNLPIASLTTEMAIYTGTLLTTVLPTMPQGLLLRVFTNGLAVGGDVEVDRIEIFPTDTPVLNSPWASYADNLEAVDIDSGSLGVDATNTQICYGAAIVFNSLYLLKERSMLQTQDSPNFEPDDWVVDPVSQAVGTCGPNAFDYGDEWLLTVCRLGVFGFNGGVPQPVDRELHNLNPKKSVWGQINWNARTTIWLRNDLIHRRFYVGVPMATPNFWLPNAPANPAPTTPNVILMCNYEGCATFDELMSGQPLRATMYGDIDTNDMKRKWSIWNIPCPYAAMIQQLNAEQLTLFFCNGIASSKIYASDPTMTTDDGSAITPLYTTYGFVNPKKGQQLQLGAGRKLATYFQLDANGSGQANAKFYTNNLNSAPWTNPLPMTLSDPAPNYQERRLELGGNHIFIEISGTTEGGYIEAGDMILTMAAHPWSGKRGVSS